MTQIVTLLQFALALFGIDVGGHTLVHHIDTGTARLHSRAQFESGVARFECLYSASGQCHYVVYPRLCAGTAAAVPYRCGDRSLERITVESGDSRRVVGLSGVRVCVGPDRDPEHADCQTY